MASAKILKLLQKPILSGSVTTASSTCGNKNCACHTSPNKLHGPYFRWSGFVDGKSRSVTINEDEALEAAKRIQNFKSLMNEIDKLKILGLQQAPWVLRKK